MFTVSSSIRHTTTQDGAVLLDLERGQMLCLNPVGAKVFELVGRGSDEDEISAQVSELFGTEIEIVRADVREFLVEMTRHGIVREDERAPEGK